MERRLANPPSTAAIGVDQLLDPVDADLTALFADSGIDTMALADHVDDLLAGQSQITLAARIIRSPLAWRSSWPTCNYGTTASIELSWTTIATASHCSAPMRTVTAALQRA